MADPKKPGDQTLPAGKPASRADAKTVLTGSVPAARRDGYEQSPSGAFRAQGESMGGTGKQKAHQATAAAPEVSQGAWRERAFTPRGVMAPADMLAALEEGLALQTTAPAPNPHLALEALLEGWLPVLRQAVEQAGGDGLDAWLQALLKPPPKAAFSPLFGELGLAVDAMRGAASVLQVVEGGRVVVTAVSKATQSPKRVSFKVLERELEGKLEVHELLRIRFATPDQIHDRLLELQGTMESLRLQLKSMPGAKPDGMYSNFARLKAETRVLSAELKRRGPA